MTPSTTVAMVTTVSGQRVIASTAASLKVTPAIFGSISRTTCKKTSLSKQRYELYTVKQHQNAFNDPFK
jgi:hypothetical protein